MEKLTPMMAQYMDIKSKYTDCILMFRLGDFYEMFLDDAIVASEILQITLTSRNKKKPKEKMCGIPYHALDSYLSKLTRAGKKVALCDQITKPDGKGIVKREVVRVVSPGTTFDESILDKKSNNYISCLVEKYNKFAFAFCDLTTGDFKVTENDNISALENIFSRINPTECIVSKKLMEENITVKSFLNKHKDVYIFNFDFTENAGKFLKNSFGVHSLKSFGLEDMQLSIYASAMLFSYLKETQKSDLKHISAIKYFKDSRFMSLDESCIYNLELFFTNKKRKREGSLNWVMDQTVTAMGGRMLKNWMLNPLLDKQEINFRLDKVSVFYNQSQLLRKTREIMSKFYDMERLLSRLSLGSGNARDMNAMKFSLIQIPKIKELLFEIKDFAQLNDDLNPLLELTDKIDKAILDDPGISLRDGGIIRDGYNTELDDLRSISHEGKSFISQMREREIKRTGISSLKIKYNKVFGYYIELSNSNLNSVPDDYIRKQTLVNAERFITPELKEYEEKVLNAESRIKELEFDLFYEVRMEIIKNIVSLQKNANIIAALDVLSNFAFIASKNNYVKPEIVAGNVIQIKNGRHPVVENISSTNSFISNDTLIDESSNFMLITGPNMGGKSTYLRQVAIIALMAQIGSFVPAAEAKLSIVDNIFTRVGASDNLVEGESTFMVEMQETSYILHNATENSLVILDEVGRGTSTYDGVSIAWSITEYIHSTIKSKTLFATHYHELTELTDKLERAKNMSVAVSENDNGVKFLYKIIDGATSKSYGIEVAKLAGMPEEITDRSYEVLAELESKNLNRKQKSTDQMRLFDTVDSKNHKSIREKSKLKKELEKININELTPLLALQKLNELKNKF